jgi:hypothetical protein
MASVNWWIRVNVAIDCTFFQLFFEDLELKKQNMKEYNVPGTGENRLQTRSKSSQEKAKSTIAKRMGDSGQPLEGSEQRRDLTSCRMT